MSSSPLPCAPALLVLGALIAGCPTSSPDELPTPDPGPAFDADLADALQLALGHARLQVEPPIAAAPGATAAVLAPDGAVWVGATGFADLEQDVAMEPGHRLRIGSITKTWVAAVALQIIDEGGLSQDDTLDGWYPEVPDAGAIRIRDLLAHTSGIPSYTDEEEFLSGGFLTPASHEDILAWAAAHGPDFAPGADWAYSNTNYYALGLILEDVTGQPLHTLLRGRLHQPLALTGTWMEGEEEGSFAPVRGYLSGIDVTPQVDPSWTWASGGLVGQALDVSRWMHALVLGDVLSETAREDQQSPVAPGGEAAPYGLGLYIVDRGHGRLLGHTGSTMGFQSDCFVHPQTGWVVTVLENDFNSEASDVADALWDVLLD